MKRSHRSITRAVSEHFPPGSMRHPSVCWIIVLFVVAGISFEEASFSLAFDRDASAIEVLKHEWHPSTVWERIGKTKFVWSATVRNNSEIRKRVYVYYDLLDARGVPLARNVANHYIDAHQTIEISSDSYIMSVDLPGVKSSRVTVKVGFP
ncbi:MAG TPA: hypothetical protein VLY20_10675 [Nitrospiria bacterium]|nr:hypothetical protein [Nitrospiria bacterium]